MKKFLTLTVILLLTLSLSFTLFACNDNIEPTEPPQIENDEVEEDNPLLTKIHNIYDNATIDPQTIKTVHDLAILTSINSSIDDVGPISVTPAILNDEQITLITLGGTQIKEGQATTMKESQLASFGKDNDYLTAVIKLFDNGTIPKDKPIMITGISLGGMIAQQILEKESILNNFEIKWIVTFGSPITAPIDRHGVKVTRFTDVNDKVPSLGESTLPLIGITRSDIDALNTLEKKQARSKYRDMVEVHALSYIEDSCWDTFDFLGDKAGTNILKTEAKLFYYDAPILDIDNNN